MGVGPLDRPAESQIIWLDGLCCFDLALLYAKGYHISFHNYKASSLLMVPVVNTEQ